MGQNKCSKKELQSPCVFLQNALKKSFSQIVQTSKSQPQCHLLHVVHKTLLSLVLFVLSLHHRFNLSNHLSRDRITDSKLKAPIEPSWRLDNHASQLSYVLHISSKQMYKRDYSWLCERIYRNTQYPNVPVITVHKIERKRKKWFKQSVSSLHLVSK